MLQKEDGKEETTGQKRKGRRREKSKGSIGQRRELKRQAKNGDSDLTRMQHGNGKREEKNPWLKEKSGFAKIEKEWLKKDEEKRNWRGQKGNLF